MTEIPPLRAETRAGLMRVAVPTVVSLLWRRGYRNMMPDGPRPLNPQARRFVGPAFTLRTVPTREDLLEDLAANRLPGLQGRSVEEVPAGGVLVVAMGGQTRTAFMGDIMTTRLKVRGVAGVILDGGVSDADAIAGIDLPVFAMGSSGLPVTSHRIVVEMNVPVEFAGVTIRPDDILMGDGNGIVVIPRPLVDEIAEAAVEREMLEEFVIGRVRDGAPLAGTYPPDEATMKAYRDWQAAKGQQA